ncbi:MAG: hypothetical protein GY711_20075 [bacterium]|nr:hypothetical protein [bacterium]
MDPIQGINATDPITGAPSEVASQDLGEDAFLTLLVTQMKNQDPLEPTANEDFIAQLAQFSSLEEMQGVNENLVALAALQQSNALMSQLTDSSALIGRNVRFIDPSTEVEALGTVDSVRIEQGLAILRIDGQDVPLANVTEVTGDDPVDPDPSEPTDPEAPADPTN